MIELHEVGLIQPVGAMVAYDARTELLCASSENTFRFLDIQTFDDGLGQAAEKSLGGKLLHALRNAAALPSLSNEPEPLGVFDFGHGPFDARAHQREHLILVELLPAEAEPQALRLVQDVSRLAFSANYSPTPVAAFRDIVKLLQLMSGYERVQLTKFLSDGNGQVIADTYRAPHSKKSGVLTPLMILKSNRAFNFVADTSFESVRVLGTFPDLLDTKYCQFNCPHNKTLERLFRCGIKAELTQPLYQGNQLWGQIVFQSRFPQTPKLRFKYILQSALPVIQSTVARLETGRNLA